MPKVRHKTLTNTRQVLGSLVLQLDEKGEAEVTEEYYKAIVNGGARDFKVVAVRKPASGAKDETTGTGTDDLGTSKAENAAAAIVTIDGIETVEALKAYTEGETRVTVLKAAEDKLAELEQE